MLNIKEYEGKTEKEALEHAIAEEHCSKEDLFYETIFEEGKLFKSAKYKVRTLTKEQLNQFILSFFQELGSLMGLAIQTEIHYQDVTATISLNSDQNAILIGKDGRTLNSIQVILRQAIRKEFNSNLKILVDVGDYKEKKLRNLEREVKNLAHEVKLSGMESALDPMNSYERRFVHSIVAELDGVTTESIGEGKERHVIIKKEQ